jgi:predicted  nucleic acid-binding Zn-ribbon protein
MARKVIKFIIKNENDIDLVAQISNIKVISVTKKNYLELVKLREDIKTGKTLVEENGKIVGFVPKDALDNFENEQNKILSKVNVDSILLSYDKLQTELNELKEKPLTGHISDSIKKLEKKIQIFERDFSPVMKEYALSNEVEDLKNQSSKLNEEINKLVLTKETDKLTEKRAEKSKLDATLSEKENELKNPKPLTDQEEFILTKEDRKIQEETKNELNALYKEMLSKEKGYAGVEIKKPEPVVQTAPTDTQPDPQPEQEQEQEQELGGSKTGFFKGIIFKIKSLTQKEAAISNGNAKSMKKALKKKLNVPFNDKKYLELADYNLNQLKNYETARTFYEIILENMPGNQAAIEGIEKIDKQDFTFETPKDDEEFNEENIGPDQNENMPDPLKPPVTENDKMDQLLEVIKNLSGDVKKLMTELEVLKKSHKKMEKENSKLKLLIEKLTLENEQFKSQQNNNNGNQNTI